MGSKLEQHSCQWLTDDYAQIFILLISYALLSIRAAVGCVALYSSQEKYSKW